MGNEFCNDVSRPKDEAVFEREEELDDNMNQQFRTGTPSMKIGFSLNQLPE